MFRSSWRLAVTASNEVGNACFGSSVALSADGTTALTGAPLDNDTLGAAWLLTQGQTWTPLGSKLTGSDESGEAWFGSTAALSGDRVTGLVGWFLDDDSIGAAWVFDRK